MGAGEFIPGSVAPAIRDGFAYGALAATKGHWYRAGSTPSSLSRSKADTLRFPLPFPFASNNGWVHNLNHWGTWRSLWCHLPLCVEAKTHPSPLDQDRLALFHRVKKMRKLLSRCRSRIPFHSSHYTMPSSLGEMHSEPRCNPRDSPRKLSRIPRSLS